MPEAFRGPERIDPLPLLLLTIILIAVFWALIVRPQQQRQREHQAMVAGLQPGQRIEGFSGIHGTLVEVGEPTVQVEIAPGVVVTMARAAVARLLADDVAATPPQTPDPVDPSAPTTPEEAP